MFHFHFPFLVSPFPIPSFTSSSYHMTQVAMGVLFIIVYLHVHVRTCTFFTYKHFYMFVYRLNLGMFKLDRQTTRRYYNHYAHVQLPCIILFSTTLSLLTPLIVWVYVRKRQFLIFQKLVLSPFIMWEWLAVLVCLVGFAYYQLCQSVHAIVCVLHITCSPGNAVKPLNNGHIGALCVVL